MEIILWFWLFDKRWLCNLRPHLKIFALIWLLPIIMNFIVLMGSLFYFYDTNLLQTYTSGQIMFLIKDAICVISLVCSIILMKDIYKNLNVNERILDVLMEKLDYFPETILPTSSKDGLNLTASREFWSARKSLLSVNGIVLLFASLSQVAWSIFHVVKQINAECLYFSNIILFADSIEIFGFLFCVLLFMLTSFIKVFSFVSAYLCPCLMNCLSDLCSKKRRVLKLMKKRKKIF